MSDKAAGQPHRSIGRYEIRREIGRGMMGVVYEAHDPLLGRTIALKAIQIAFALSPQEHEVFEQRFFAEGRIAARLSHPGIVVVHDVGRDPETGTLYMALEYLKGRTLAEIIKQGIAIEWREALHITRRIADALHHAHAHGVVHRDIKPANIMLLGSGEPKIMDFGIAKIETARIQLTASGQSFGTPLYMSPEQALGRVVDRRTDLFSLGAIAYSLLTRRPAFGAENIPKIIQRVLEDAPLPPSQLTPDLPHHVDYVVARALAKNPADRYPDGQTMAEDIEDVLADRRPRHRDAWAPAGADGMLTSLVDRAEEAELDQLLTDQGLPRPELDLATVDLEAQLATLVPPAAGEPAAPETSEAAAVADQQAPAPTGSEAPAPSPALSAPVSGRGLWERLEIWVIALVIVGALAALVVTLAARRAETPKAHDLPAASLGSSHPAARGVAPQPTMEPGRLAVEFEHTLKSGTLRIWVDRELVVEQRLDSRVARRITAFAFRSGERQESFELAPGGHDVELQVAWDDKQKTERIWGDFNAGATRRLHASMGGLFRNLSLEWQ